MRPRDRAADPRRASTAPAIDPNAIAVAERTALPARAEREAAKVLAAACHIARLRIVRALVDTPLAASDLARITGRTASGTSQHLRVLREAGAVTADRKGNVIRYRLSGERAAEILATIARAFDPLRRDG